MAFGDLAASASDSVVEVSSSDLSISSFIEDPEEPLPIGGVWRSVVPSPSHSEEKPSGTNTPAIKKNGKVPGIEQTVQIFSPQEEIRPETVTFEPPPFPEPPKENPVEITRSLRKTTPNLLPYYEPLKQSVAESTQPVIDELSMREPDPFKEEIHFLELCVRLKNNTPLTEFKAREIKDQTLTLGNTNTGFTHKYTHFTETQWERLGKAVKENNTLNKVIFEGVIIRRVSMGHLIEGLTKNRRLNSLVFNNCRIDRDGWGDLQDLRRWKPWTVTHLGSTSVQHKVGHHKKRPLVKIERTKSAPLLLSMHSNRHRSSSLTCLIMAGIVCKPARCAARHRRSPAMSS